MSLHKPASFLMLIAVLLTGSACVVARHPAGIASETTPLDSEYTIIGPTERSSCRNWIFGIPLSAMSRTREVIDEMVKEKGADALIGVTVEYTGEVFAIPVVGASCLIVKGLAVKGAK